MTRRTVADGDAEIEALAESEESVDADTLALSHDVGVREPLGEDDSVTDDEADRVFNKADREFCGVFETVFEDDAERVTETVAESDRDARVDDEMEGEKELEPE